MSLTRRAVLLRAGTTLAGSGALSACRELSAEEAAPQAPSPELSRVAVGATFHGFWNYDSAWEALLALQRLKDAGGSWVRIDVGWAAVEPERGVWSEWALEKYDAAIAGAGSVGLEVLLVLHRVPEWASGSSDFTLAPDDISAFGDFALVLSERYAGSVRAIELWNEPNHSEFFTAREPGAEAREHVEMVRDAYTKIADHGPRGDDALTVFAGGSSGADVQWWEQLYSFGIREVTDIVAVNPYPTPADIGLSGDEPDVVYQLDEVDALSRVMSDHGDHDKPIWFTEIGWSTHRNEAGTADWERGVSAAHQAELLEETMRAVESKFPQVEKVFWYNLRDRAEGGSLHSSHFGLLDRDLRPKPSLERLEKLFRGT